MIKILLLIILVFAGCVGTPAELPEMPETQKYKNVDTGLGRCTITFQDGRLFEVSDNITIEACIQLDEDLKGNGSVGGHFSHIYRQTSDFRMVD